MSIGLVCRISSESDFALVPHINSKDAKVFTGDAAVALGQSMYAYAPVYPDKVKDIYNRVNDLHKLSHLPNLNRTCSANSPMFTITRLRSSATLFPAGQRPVRPPIPRLTTGEWKKALWRALDPQRSGLTEAEREALIRVQAATRFPCDLGRLTTGEQEARSKKIERMVAEEGPDSLREAAEVAFKNGRLPPARH